MAISEIGRCDWKTSIPYLFVIMAATNPNSMLAVPWTPVLNGKEVSSCDLYNRVVEDEAKPAGKHDEDWLRRSLEVAFAEAPQGAEALWECMLAIWRLKVEEEDGSEDDTWKDLLCAWLVRGH